MAAKAKVKNMAQVNAKLSAMAAAVRGPKLAAAAQAGMLIIVNDAKFRVHKVTSTLARSLHVGPAQVDGLSATVRGGTDVEYGAAEEFGTPFRPPHPYLRPAYDSKKGEAVDESAASLRDIVRSSAR